MSESQDILQQLKSKGDKKAYAKFYHKYYTDLVSWSNSIVCNVEAAEDIVQDFFVVFLERKKYNAVLSNLQSYVFRAVRNASINYLKRQEKLIRNTDILHDKVAANVDVAAMQDAQIVYMAINELSEKSRAVFNLCCVQGYTYNEAAKELNISINTVRTHMSRAFKFLRKRLESPHLFLLLLSRKY